MGSEGRLLISKTEAIRAPHKTILGSHHVAASLLAGGRLATDDRGAGGWLQFKQATCNSNKQNIIKLIPGMFLWALGSRR